MEQMKGKTKEKYKEDNTMEEKKIKEVEKEEKKPIIYCYYRCGEHEDSIRSLLFFDRILLKKKYEIIIKYDISYNYKEIEKKLKEEGIELLELDIVRDYDERKELLEQLLIKKGIDTYDLFPSRPALDDILFDLSKNDYLILERLEDLADNWYSFNSILKELSFKKIVLIYNSMPCSNISLLSKIVDYVMYVDIIKYNEEVLYNLYCICNTLCDDDDYKDIISEILKKKSKFFNYIIEQDE